MLSQEKVQMLLLLQSTEVPLRSSTVTKSFTSPQKALTEGPLVVALVEEVVVALEGETKSGERVTSLDLESLVPPSHQIFRVVLTRGRH